MVRRAAQFPQKGRPFSLTVVNTSDATTDEAVGRFVKRLDRLAKRHRDRRLTAAVVFLGDYGMDEARLKSIAESRKLRHVSLAVMTNCKELEEWDLDADRPTNAYLVRHSKISKHFTADCPVCDQLPSKISMSLRTMLASGRARAGYLPY